MKKISASSGVVRYLIEYIHGEGLTTGDRLPSIRQLADEWNVNTSSVRDGLLQAQTMGLIKLLPRSGAFVQSLDFSSLVDAFSYSLETALMQQDTNLLHLVDARCLIEAEVASRAAAMRRPEDMLPLRALLDLMRNMSGVDRSDYVQADERYHMGLARIAGNPVLTTILQALLVLLRPHRLSMIPTEGKLHDSTLLHEDIYGSVMEGDAERARQLVHEHLTEQRQDLLDRLETSSSRHNV